MLKGGFDDVFILGLLLGSDFGFEDGVRDVFILGIFLRSGIWFKYGIWYGTVLGLILVSEDGIKYGYLLVMCSCLYLMLGLKIYLKMGSHKEET